MRARIFTFILVTCYLLLITPTVFAQAPVSTPSSSLNTKYDIQNTTSPLPPTVSPISPLYTDLLVSNLFHSFSCLAVGQSVIGQPCLSYQVTQNAQGMMQTVPVLSQVNTQGGVLGTATSLIGMLYTNPPVRTVDYIGSLGEQFGVIKTAHAQVVGSGAAVLNPILRLWQVSRNISYVLMIIIFVVIGIMIMFRHKLNPQTVITAQAALPGLVIGLIMITFSFFLAGLVSDMAFVGTNVVGYYFSAVRGNPGDQNLVSDISQKNVLSLFTPFTRSVGKGEVSNALSAIWNDLNDPNMQGSYNPLDMDPARALTLLSALITAQFILPFGNMFGGTGQLVSGAIAAVAAIGNPTAVAGLALSFIAMAALIYAMFKLFLRLINNYLSIIFLTLSAPFQLLAAALPGRQGMATNWILNMLANVLAFPAVLAVLYFVAFVLGPNNSINTKCIQRENTDKVPCAFKVTYLNQNQDNFAGPVYAEGEANPNKITGTDTLPLLGGLKLDFINMLLAFGALLALPSIPDIVVKAIGKTGPAGELIGREIGGGIGQGRQYSGQVQQGSAGFAQQAGNLRTQPLRYAREVTDPVTGKTRIIWDESNIPIPGVGAPTQGTISRMTSSRPWRWITRQKPLPPVPDSDTAEAARQIRVAKKAEELRKARATQHSEPPEPA